MNRFLKSLELSITERCNRKCCFCPHGVGFQPNISDMTIETAESIANSLKDMNFCYRLGLSGRGEPLLHPNILDIVKTLRKGLSGHYTFEIITNGDMLNQGLILDLLRLGITKIIVSMHDGEHQIPYFNNMFKSRSDSFVLRNHWNKSQISLNNRCGDAYKNDSEIHRVCYIPFYKGLIRENGDVGLCCQDWKNVVRAGNINDGNLSDIWLSDTLNMYRKRLVSGDRGYSPCNSCDIQGDLRGEDSFRGFVYEFEKNNR